MTVNELIHELQLHRDMGFGEAEMFDTDAHPIIGTSVSDDDQVNELNRVYIEVEF